MTSPSRDRSPGERQHLEAGSTRDQYSIIKFKKNQRGSTFLAVIKIIKEVI